LELTPKEGTFEYEFYKLIIDFITDSQFLQLKREIEDAQRYRNKSRSKRKEEEITPNILDYVLQISKTPELITTLPKKPVPFLPYFLISLSVLPITTSSLLNSNDIL